MFHVAYRMGIKVKQDRRVQNDKYGNLKIRKIL